MADERQHRGEADRRRWWVSVAENATPTHHLGRFDPRAITLSAVVAFALLLASTEWALLAAVGGWLTLAWLLSKPDPEPLRAGLVFGAILAAGAFAFALGGGLGPDAALRRALRAALLVMAATWLRAAARAAGLREVSRRALGRLHKIPSATEAAAVLATSSRRAASRTRHAPWWRGSPTRPSGPRALLDAVLTWVVREAAHRRRSRQRGARPWRHVPRTGRCSRRPPFRFSPSPSGSRAG